MKALEQNKTKQKKKHNNKKNHNILNWADRIILKFCSYLWLLRLLKPTFTSFPIENWYIACKIW